MARKRPRPGRVVDKSDPQRGRWGGAPERAGRRLEARFDSATKTLFYFDLVVRSTDQTPLKGPVIFYLHDRFAKDVVQISKIQEDNTAVLEWIDAKKVFTVGAQVRDAAGNWVGLELYLADMPNLPRRFLPRRSPRKGEARVKGTDLEKLHLAIVEAFGEPEFERLLAHKLNVRLDDITGPGAFSHRAFQTIQYAEQHGVLTALVDAVARARPQRHDIQALYRQFTANLAAEAGRADSDAKVQEAYGKAFGDKPPVDLQKAGAREAVVPAQDPGFERTLRADLGFLDAAVWPHRLQEARGQVCRIELNDPPYDTMATGFLVGPDAVLTNYHVLEKVIAGLHPAAAVRFRFDYQSTMAGKASDGASVELAQAAAPGQPWLLKFAPYGAGEGKGTPDVPPPQAGELDYALVRLARAIGNEAVAGTTPPRGWVEVPEAQPPLAGLPLLMILQHPERKRLQLAFDTEPQVELKFGGLRARYAINTETGSSGSPVFDKDWNLVALHQYDPATGKSNQGIPIGLIRNDLGALAKQILGPAAAPLPKLEMVSAAVEAVTTALQSGTSPSRADVVAVVAHSTDAVLSAPISVQALSAKVREIIDKKLTNADKTFADDFEKSEDPADWAKAADRYRKTICGILKSVKQVEGGELPDDLYHLWAKHGCA